MKSRTQGFEEIQDRLLKLEKQSRRFKRIGAVMVAIVSVVVVMGQAASRKTVEANEFIVRDESGNIRAKLWMNAALGAPEILLTDDKGKPTVKVQGGVGKTGIGGSVIVLDAEGRERGTLLAANLLGGALLSFTNADGSPKTTG